MKKMCKLLSMLLAVMMLLTSAALAEGNIPMNYMEIGDVQFVMDGETVLDLSELKLKLGAGMTENGEAAVTADLTAGDKEAVSALVGVAEGKGVANVAGMSKPLTADLMSLLTFATEDMMDAFMEGFMGSFTEEEQAALQQIFGAVEKLASGEGMDAYEDALAAYMDAVAEVIANNVTVDKSTNEFYADMSGTEQDATIETLVLTNEDVVKLMRECYTMYDSMPEMLDLINGILVLGGEEPIESISGMMTEEVCAEAVNELMGDCDLVIDVYENMDGSMFDVVVNVVDDAAAEAPEVIATLDVGIGVTDSVIFVMQLTEENGDSLYGQFDMIPSEDFAGQVETSFYLEVSMGEETTTLVSAWFGPDPDYGQLGTISLMPDSETEAVGIAWGIADAQYIFSMYDNYNSIECGYIGENDTNGMVYLSYDDGASVMEISGNVAMTTGEYPVENVAKLAAAEGIDLLTATEADFEPLAGEMTQIGMNAIFAIMDGAPDLGALLGEMLVE